VSSWEVVPLVEIREDETLTMSGVVGMERRDIFEI
jgi:hypothetical protein